MSGLLRRARRPRAGLFAPRCRAAAHRAKQAAALASQGRALRAREAERVQVRRLLEAALRVLGGTT